MRSVHIFTTSPLPEGAKDFTNGRMKFTFSALDVQGPRQVIEGPMFLFVDWALAELSGLEMCRRLRAHALTAGAHVTMVLESEDAEDRRRSLAAGADDYMLGPVSRQKVLDRVLALYETTSAPDTPPIVLGDLVVDVGMMRARWRGEPIPLAESAILLLSFLAQHPNQVHTRQELLAAMGKAGAELSERTADVWMRRLRTGLQQVGIANALTTVRRRGYALELPGAARQRR